MKGIAAAAANFVKAKTPTKKDQQTTSLVPFSLSLGGNKLTFTGKKWALEDSVASTLETDITVLQAELKKLKAEKDDLKDASEKLRGEKNLADFKNQLLIEMLAVSQLDAEKTAESLQKSILMNEALQWELSKITLAKSNE